MALSEARKAANAKWDKKNMTTLGCKVKRETAIKFKEYASKQGKTANTILKEYVDECIKDNSKTITVTK